MQSVKKTLDGKINYEVIIVDDASTDGSVSFFNTLESPYHVIYNSKQRGFAKNNNLAASRAKGEYLCLLNNDVFVDGDWLQPMIKVFEDNQNVGVVGNVQRLAFSKKYDHMGVVFGPLGNPDITDRASSIDHLRERSNSGVLLLPHVAWSEVRIF